VRVTTDEPATAISKLLASSRGVEVLGIEVVRPGLASAFLVLTGRRFADGERQPS
jgi:hypothetical protein